MSVYPLVSRPLVPRVSATPRLAERDREPLWVMPAESSGRGWLVSMMLLTILGLFSWSLSFYNSGGAGGHGSERVFDDGADVGG